MVFQEYVRAINEHTERLGRLEQELHEQVKSWRLYPVVEALQALRGVQFTVAVTTVAELGDLTRVENPRQLMKCLGLIPSESSSGERRRQGTMTRAGIPMRVVPWSKGLGPLATPPTSVGIYHCGSNNHPKPSRISAGRRTCGCANAFDA